MTNSPTAQPGWQDEALKPCPFCGSPGEMIHPKEEQEDGEE